MVVEVVLHGYIEQEPDVRVRHAVEHRSTGLATSHQTDQPELSQLVTGGGLRGLNDGSKIPDTELSGLQECVHHSYPSRISQHLESGRQLHRIFGG